MSTVQTEVTGDEGSTLPISTVAGTGDAGSSGDDGMAVSARLDHPYGVAVDGGGALYLSDHNNHRVRKVAPDGKISKFAGTGEANHGGDGGLATTAKLNGPRGVAVDSAGTVYIADSGNHMIRKVTADGKITRFAGTGAAGCAGDGGLADAAKLNRPYGVAVDSTGAVYIADCDNHRVRKVTPDGKISTFAGTASAGSAGEGGPAASAELNRPYAVAVDGADNVYIADYNNHRICRVTEDRKIHTFAGAGIPGSSGDDGLATSARLHGPVGVAVDSTNTVYIADHNNHRVRKVTADGKIRTFVGTNTPGSGSGGSPAASAQLNYPMGLAVDSTDALYIADYANNQIRKVASARLPRSGTVACWTNARSRLRMAVARESTKDGAEVHQNLAVIRDCQRWRLIVVGQEAGDVLYRIENVRSGKALEVVGGQKWAGAVIAQRTYEGAEARHQQWRLIPVCPAADGPQMYEIANHHSGLLLHVDTNARATIRQDAADGNHRSRQWQLLPV